MNDVVDYGYDNDYGPAFLKLASDWNPGLLRRGALAMGAKPTLKERIGMGYSKVRDYVKANKKPLAIGAGVGAGALAGGYALHRYLKNRKKKRRG